MLAKASPAEYRFDGWTLQRASGELIREGRRVRLQDHPFQILEALLARPGEVVTREELIGRLWPGRIVDFETGLNTSVRRLRAALGDEADTPRYIETVPRRGYRFIGTLETPPAIDQPAGDVVPPPSPPARRRPGWWAVPAVALTGLVAAALLLWRSPPPANPGPPPAAEGPTLVVLPFLDLAAEGDSQLFADGLTEELIHRLAQLEGLRVIARTSAFAYRDRDTDISTVARELGVSHVLEGSVRRAGDRLRVTAQLIDARTSTHLWSRNYDRAAGGLFDIQDDLAAQVAAKLDATLDGRSPARHPDPAAYEKFLVGRHLFQRRAPGDVSRAIQQFEQAVAADPTFARAWAGLSSAYFIAVTDGTIGRDEGFDKLEHAARRAIELDPAIAEPWARLAIRASWLGDRETSRRLWQKAAELDPDDPLVLTTNVSRAKDAGRTDEALAIMRRIVMLDPLAVAFRHNLAVELYLLGRYEEAVAEERETAALITTHERAVECSSLMMLGRFGEALALAGAMPNAADALRCRALAEFGRGAAAESDAALAALIEDHGDSRQFEIAEVHGYRGERAEAFAWLQRHWEHCAAIEGSPPACWPEKARRSSLMSALRGDPRWAELSGPG